MAIDMAKQEVSNPKLGDLRALGKTPEYIFNGIAWRGAIGLKRLIPQSQI